MRVLIADDQRSVGTSLADLVRLCEHDVVEVVGTGMEAIQAYNRHRPNVVLMDYRMPKLNGVTACRYILAKDPNARIILISGWTSSNEADFAGTIAVLPKPVTLEVLRNALVEAAKPRPHLQREIVAESAAIGEEPSPFLAG